MTSSFPSISHTLAYFEKPDPVKLAAEEKARHDALAERLRISSLSEPSKSSFPSHQAAAVQDPRPEIPPRPTRKQESERSRSIPESVRPISYQSSAVHPNQDSELPNPETEMIVLRNEISDIKVEVQDLKDQLELRNKEFKALNESLRDAELRYQDAVVDMQRSKEEKQKLEDMVERLRRELDKTRATRDEAETQLATKRRELFNTSELLSVREQERMEEARRAAFRNGQDETKAASSQRIEDEVARRMNEQSLIDAARREGRREGRKESRRNNVTIVMQEKPRSAGGWSFLTGHSR